VRAKDVFCELEKNSSGKNAEGMARFAISGSPAYGTGMPFLRALARRAKKEEKSAEARNALALELWAHGFHEDKVLASLLAEPSIGWKTADKWAAQCLNWAETDQLAMNLLWRMEGAPQKALEYSASGNEWVKRTGFALMAVIPWRMKKGFPDALADEFLAAIERESADERNFVKKAANWALRHIGKTGSRRNHAKALALARKLAKSGNKTARWIGSDAARELGERKPE
jgi:3-methyladenine DNA glycosylase AlkD